MLQKLMTISNGYKNQMSDVSSVHGNYDSNCVSKNNNSSFGSPSIIYLASLSPDLVRVSIIAQPSLQLVGVDKHAVGKVNTLA